MLSRNMPPIDLLYTNCISPEVIDRVSWLRQTCCIPQCGISRMLQHPSELPHLPYGDQGLLLISAILQMAEPSPRTTRRVRNYGVRTVIQYRISRFVPTIHPFDRWVWAARIDVERRNGS